MKIKIHKKPDDPRGTRVSIVCASDGCSLVYRGTKEEAMKCLRAGIEGHHQVRSK